MHVAGSAPRSAGPSGDAGLRTAPAAPLAFVDRYLPALLAQASQLISAPFHAVVDAAGLSVLEWRVLSTLVGSGAISIGQLAQKVVTKQPTVTRLLHRMEAQGHVQRADHALDGRITLVRVTASGERLVASLIAQAEAHERQVLAALGEPAAQQLRAVLRGLIAQQRQAAP